MFVWVQVELLELFLSPLLGIDNSFKTLVANALKFSTKFYEENFPQSFVKSGTIRIPKNKVDEDKFNNYIPYMDFPFEKKIMAIILKQEVL